jgi:hypothetical protein
VIIAVFTAASNAIVLLLQFLLRGAENGMFWLS